MVVCERELETEQNCNILTPTLLNITAFFPVLLGFSTGGLGPTLLGAGFLYCTWSPTHLISNWLNFLCTELYNSSTPTFFCGRHKSHSFNPSTVKVIFWYSSTECTCYLHRCISYFDSSPGSEVNIQHDRMVEISPIIEKRPGNLGGLAVSQSSVKDHQR